MTIGTLSIYRGLAFLFSNGRPVYMSIQNADKIFFLGGGYVWGIPIPVIIFAISVALMILLLNCTTFGRYIRAIGGNENAAYLAGINVDKYKTLAYGICGLMAALGGVLITARTGTGEPSLGEQWELDAIASVVIGGTVLTGGIGGIEGTVAGVIIIGIISNLLNLLNVSSYYQYVSKGLIIIAAVLLRSKKDSK